MDSTPPTKFDELPDYYHGRLIVYEPLSTDKCRWVVYDGCSKVRCYTRTEAVDYIDGKVMNTSDETTQRIARARYFQLKAVRELDLAAQSATGADRLLMERLSVRLRPFIVEIDNILSPLLNKRENEQLQDRKD